MLAKRLQVESGLVQLPSQWRMAGLETLRRKRFVLLNVNTKNVLFD